MNLIAEIFEPEIEQALRTFDKYVVCLEKTPTDFLESLKSLMTKAIDAYETRGPGMRHGIALDRQVTIILSQNDADERPLCGIYFNLSSPYHKKRVKRSEAPRKD